MARYTGKTIVITGAGSGIGAAAAKRFSQEGANVVVMGRKEAALREATRDLPPERTLVQPGDTSKAADAEAVIKAAVDRFGGIDVLVNNAGTHTSGELDETSEQEWKRVIDVNVHGYFHMAKAALPELKKTKGSIVMTSSVSGIGGDWHMAAYNTSKGAVSNMVRAMALDHGKDGVRVNAVNPTFTDTGMTEGAMNEKTIAKFVARIPMRRIGQPEDIAAVMAFLASDDARFVTGVNLPVDGGLTASNGQPQM